MTIPLVDLAAQYRSIKPEIDAAIQRVLDLGHFILGPEVDALERELAASSGTAHAVALASGTDALELTLKACGIGAGDEVITTSLSFFATAEAVVAVGATPVFVDIEPVTYCLNPDQVAAKVSPRTKAILPVHLYGHPCDMDALTRIAKPRNLLIIEDCAQAIGARYREQRVGSFGIAGCFSFYPTKNLGAYGDGGLVVTNDAKVADQLRMLRIHGSRDRVRYDAIGRNSRLDELQAAILRAKLPHLEAWNEARRQHAETYRRLIAEAGASDLILPQERPGCRHVYHLFVVRSQRRDALVKALLEQGIRAQVHYAVAMPHQPVLAYLRPRRGDFPVAEQVADEVLSLPLYPELTPALIRQVVETLAHAMRAPQASRLTSA